MDRSPGPITLESFFMLPTPSRLEVPQMPMPAGLTPPPPLSLYPSSLSLDMTPAPDSSPHSASSPGEAVRPALMGGVPSWVISSGGAGSEGTRGWRWSSVMMRNRYQTWFRGSGVGVGGAQDGSQEVRFVVQSRSKF